MPKRQKIYYKPRHLTGVFPAIVILAVMLFVGAGTYIAPAAYGSYANTGIDNYLGAMANAQLTYHNEHGVYTSDTGKLRTSDGQRPSTPPGVTGKLISVCADGWVAYAVAYGQKGGRYVTNVDTVPGTVEQTTFPSCITAAELGKTTLGYTVTVTGIKVTRSATVGSHVPGAVSRDREGVSVTWAAKNTCSSAQTPLYTVQFVNADDTHDTHGVTTRKTGVALAGIQNGVKYAVSIAGRCGEKYPAGRPTTVKFTQSLPKSAGLLVRWLQNAKVMSLLYSAVSTNPAVHYQIQYLPPGGTWHTLTKNLGPDEAALRVAGYTPSYGTQYRIRGASHDNTVVGSWSNPRTVQFRTGSVYGYGY